ncbi:hypothetical protein [Thermococcus barossii]|uniref:DUF7982 domain-containing protein n=1 Tax=Thermococcus barossii TaxID=54077 RepID=A0A2Z2MPC8_9EURY|nr:hypothetical protein [Thermococcus barossii]ASJ05714.1 hypothetical protein A3L01_10190 [Thermococcus barossii]
METKNIVSGVLVIGGGALALHGFLSASTGLINLGIAGAFLGAVIFTFKSSKYVKKESIENLLEPYKRVFSSFSDNLALGGNAIYIPPYENLPNGGLFIPLHENFELDLARLDEKTVFLTDVPNERAMGLFLGPFGASLVEKYEEHMEAPLDGAGSSAVESAAGSVLRTLGLARRVYIEENEDGFRAVIQPEIECEPETCEKAPCPICASVLLALAKATGELLLTEKVEEKDYGIEITVKKLGGVGEWM